MDTKERRLGDVPCEHADFNAFHLEVLEWAKGWAETLHRESGGDPSREYTRVWTGDDFLKARPERFRGCNLACRAFVQDVLHCLHGDIDPATMLILEP